MMLHRMKYLLKIPLLAISVACNRSAQEIKMIVLQSPIPWTFSFQPPPPSLSTRLKTTPCISSTPPTPPQLHTLQTFAASSSDVSSPWQQSVFRGVSVGGPRHPILITGTLSQAGEKTPPGNYTVRDANFRYCCWSAQEDVEVRPQAPQRAPAFRLPSKFLPSCPGKEWSERNLIGCLSCKFLMPKGTGYKKLCWSSVFHFVTSGKTFWRCTTYNLSLLQWYTSYYNKYKYFCFWRCVCISVSDMNINISPFYTFQRR